MSDAQPRQTEMFRFSKNVALCVGNVDAATSFYRDTLGFQVVGDPLSKDGVEIRKGDMTFWLDDASRDSAKVGQTVFEFVVTDLACATDVLKAKGCSSFLETSSPDHVGRMFKDPFGMKFHLFQPVTK